MSRQRMTAFWIAMVTSTIGGISLCGLSVKAEDAPSSVRVAAFISGIMLTGGGILGGVASVIAASVAATENDNNDSDSMHR